MCGTLLAVLALLVGSLASSGFAQPQQHATAQEATAETPVTQAQNLTQNELNTAASQHLASSDFMLNKAYEQLMSVLDSDRGKQLEAAQQAWAKFRDLNAGVISSAYEGGSIRPLIHTQALIEMTDHRAAELTRMHLAEITP